MQVNDEFDMLDDVKDKEDHLDGGSGITANQADLAQQHQLEYGSRLVEERKHDS